jgi:hypothetical protein
MMRSSLATLALGLTLAAAPTTPALAAKATAKPGKSWLSRYAATRTARSGFSRWMKNEEQLNRQYAANKSMEAGRGTGFITGLGLGTAGMGVAIGDSYGMSGPVGVEIAGMFGLLGYWAVRNANAQRDLARGDTVRFALANGFKVDRSIISAMKQSGRFGAFDAKTIAAFKLQRKPKKAKG